MDKDRLFQENFKFDYGKYDLLGQYKGQNVYAVKDEGAYWRIPKRARCSGVYWAIVNAEKNNYNLVQKDYMIGEMDLNGSNIVGMVWKSFDREDKTEDNLLDNVLNQSNNILKNLLDL